MEITVGAIMEGTIKSITKFGAFVALPGGRSGLCHISEISHSYVTEVRDFLTEGQAVKVKVVGIEDAGRINLSIKKAQDPPPRPAAPARRNSAPVRSAAAPREPQTFEDKLKAFMADSDSKLSSIRQYSEHKTKSRRR